MKMTFEEYDKVMDRFDRMTAPSYLPTLDEINSFEKDPDKWLMFACYCHDRIGKQTDPDGKARKKALMSFINRHLELTDDDE